jgi:predicted metal-dependent HD superfamily phosphohydrolase
MTRPKLVNYDPIKDAVFEELIKFAVPSLNRYDVLRTISKYNEPWRRYHNAGHIIKMFNLAPKMPGLLSSTEQSLLNMMIIFHDVEYKLGREAGWNEQESADYATEVLERSGELPTHILQVRIGIIATITHSLDEVPKKLQELVGFLIDTDLLAGLGTNQEEFAHNSLRIMLEHSPCYTSKEYRQGRREWAQRMLGREKIFVTERFSERYEKIARDNLTLVVEDTY